MTEPINQRESGTYDKQSKLSGISKKNMTMTQSEKPNIPPAAAGSMSTKEKTANSRASISPIVDSMVHSIDENSERESTLPVVAISSMGAMDCEHHG